MHQFSITRFIRKAEQILFSEKKGLQWIIRAIWITSASLLMIISLYVYLVIKNPFDWFGDMPGLAEVENPENDLSSEIISADAVSLGRYFRYHRSPITYNQLPPHLVQTLLVSEDHRFREHSGMDFFSYLRVAYGLLTLNPQGGGSTLSQQTAKNLFETRGEELQGTLGKSNRYLDLLISKTKEWILAVRLERNLTKEEIITLYLNTVPFNNHAYGIRVASETYFNKRVADLSVEESALLVGMLQSPYTFNPVRHPQRALAKRNEVMRKLFTHGHIPSRRQYDSLCALPIALNFNVHSHNEGLATYFRSIIKQDMLRWCKANGYDLYESGLKIHVTLDSRLQRYAEEAMEAHMKNLQADFNDQWGTRNPWVDNKGNERIGFAERKIKRTDHYRSLVKRWGAGSDSVWAALTRKKKTKVFTWQGERDTMLSALDSIRHYNKFLNAGLMAMNPNTGEVKAWVGGINHKYFKFDHVRQARRQPGSTFKAFVFGKAMEDGYSPCYVMHDVSPAINIYRSVYQPANSDGTYGDGSMHSLRSALAHSLNSVTMQLMDKLRPRNVASFANRLGIESELNPVYSLGLGTSEVSLYEMVGAYSAFVNLGIHTRPFMITRIEDRYGNVLESFTPERSQVMDQLAAYKTVYMLRGVVEEEGGSASALSYAVREDNEVGGKTGTTNNASDGWYIGITPDLVTGIWVGGDEPSIHFPNWTLGAGGRSALPMWDIFMQKVYGSHEGYRKGKFKRPDVPNPDQFDCPPHAELNTFAPMY